MKTKKYLLDKFNKDYQCEIPYIPYGTYDTALRSYSIQSEESETMWVNSGYDGYHLLEFYGKPQKGDFYFEGEHLGEVVFPTFKTAYEFIKANKLDNYNLRCGCYKKEIKQYEKELKHG